MSDNRTTDMDTPVVHLSLLVNEFVMNRDWDKFHNSKDLAIAISVEANELLEKFLWVKESRVEGLIESEWIAIREELADIVIFCLTLANKVSIDISLAVQDKLIENAKKYPISEWKGRAR